MEKRAAAFARLFEAVHEGVYIGTIAHASTTTFAANAHLKLIFGYASETPEGDVRPFDANRLRTTYASGATANLKGATFGRPKGQTCGG